MARRKPNVTPRVRPSEALKNPPSPEVPGHAPQLAEDQGDTLPAQELAPGPGEVVDFPEPEVTLGEMMSTTVLKAAFQTPPMDAAANLMSDVPFPGQTPDDSDRNLVPPLPLPVHEDPPAPQAAPQVSVPTVGRDAVHGPADGGSHRPGAVGDRSVNRKYIHRITIADAYQFDGRVQTAPPWIDRNWLSFDDKAMDETGVGIVLDVPLIGICRRGDYVVQQSVIMDETGYAVDRLAVYAKDDFERIFLAVS